MSKMHSTAVATLLCDFYKTAHRHQYKPGTQAIYSTWTPRSNKHLPQVTRIVQFGLQGFIKKYLLDFFEVNFFQRNKEEVIKEYQDFIWRTLGIHDDASHLSDLHDFGHLPVTISAIPEGRSVKPGVPMVTVFNTHPKFYWLTNYLETLMSTCLWQPMTSASIAREYLKLMNEFALKTCDDTSHVDFQCHDFSMRGMSSLESAEISGAGHLTSFMGTDTIPAIHYAEHYYGSDGMVGTSIPATEHSVMCSHASDTRDELETFRFLIEDVYPKGFVSIVSDTWDFWKNVDEVLPALKDKILARDGKVVIRPDSGDPVDILVGTTNVRKADLLPAFIGEGYFDLPEAGIVKVRKTELDVKSMELLRDDRTSEEIGLIERLWEIFGGTVNSKGYKVLNPKIGAIYGDSINLSRAQAILEGLERKGFASSNVVFGVGSFTYQYLTRDSLGFAMKATYAIIDGEEKFLFKDPKTDDGTKRSQRGLVAVMDNGSTCVDGLSSSSTELDNSELVPVFVDGELIADYSFDEVRKNVADEIYLA